ncbi:MAG TPA: hypothetical protein VE954_20660 [Oligoflexus sp.]|uniref:hypothetical protein n=1 Tax=Oligoflexus sp. TaxID=1971216 RepID=UPI002D758653|nr:hypothetical protein [Oligoflexus sp.]HYX35515.1 hypothetical protein [Oligoflexus sp.]
MGFFLGRILLPLLLLPWAEALHAAALASPDEPNFIRPGHRFFRFPVTWELMRSGFNALDVALEAESYAEYWAILYMNPDEIDLLTPRGRARVVGIASDPQTPAGYPDMLIVNEGDLARLLGLEPDPAQSVEQVVFIKLPVHDNNEQTLALKASAKYFVSVQLTMSF